jgi:hypothetical protein
MFKRFISRLFHLFGSKLLSRTGEQFYGVDNYSDGKSILEVMVEKDSVFFRGLSKFENVRFYANAILDRTVPYVTAAVEEFDPFLLHETNGIKVKFDEQYSPVVESWSLPDTPPVKPKPRPFYKKVFSSNKDKSDEPKKQRPPRLPPFLRFRFPLNIIFYVSLPILIPLFFSYLTVQSSIETRASRKRIKLLETEIPTTERLSSLLTTLESELDGTVMSIMEAEHPDMDGTLGPEFTKEYEEVQPTFTASQKKMIKNLNSLPNLKKTLVYLDNLTNSHGTIVARDLKHFPEQHKRGHGGIHHWADHFIL